jgi:hypothetical protein
MLRNIRFILAVGLLIIGALVACAPAAAPIPQVTIKAHDYSYDGPTKLNAGLVTIKLTNEGQEMHHAQLARLNDGVSMDQIEQAFQTDPNAALALVTLVGGPGAIGPGQSTEVTLDLAAGQYLAMCFIPSADGVPHMAQGMLSTFVVEGTRAAAAEPQADRTITLKDFMFDLPAQVKAGVQTWKIVNSGPQPHEIIMFRLNDGKTMDDVMAWAQTQAGAPPFNMIGGMQGLTPGQTGWVTLDLKPGSYVAACDIPDPTSGKPHSELGMLMPFTVN